MASVDVHHIVNGVTAFNIGLLVAPIFPKQILGNIIDTIRYTAVEFFLQSGVLTTGTFTPRLYEGDDPSLSDEEEVESRYVINISNAVFNASEDNIVKTFAYIGKKRYLRIGINIPISTSGTICCVAMLNNAIHNPVQGA